MFDALSDDLLRLICAKLKGTVLARFECCSKRLRTIASSPEIWKSLCGSAALLPGLMNGEPEHIIYKKIYRLFCIDTVRQTDQWEHTTMAIRMQLPTEELPLFDVVLRMVDGEREPDDDEESETRWWPIPALRTNSDAYSHEMAELVRADILLWDQARRETSNTIHSLTSAEFLGADGPLLDEAIADGAEIHAVRYRFEFNCKETVESACAHYSEYFWVDFTVDIRRKRLGIEVVYAGDRARAPLPEALELLPWAKL